MSDAVEHESDMEEALIEQMRALQKHYDDPEAVHIEADRLLITYLHEIGHEEVADAWVLLSRRVGFQCA